MITVWDEGMQNAHIYYSDRFCLYWWNLKHVQKGRKTAATTSMVNLQTKNVKLFMMLSLDWEHL